LRGNGIRKETEGSQRSKRGNAGREEKEDKDAPAPSVDKKVRMSFVATRAAKAVGLVGGQRRSVSKRVVTRAKVRELFMPALSSTMTEGKIVSWLKGSGEKISKGESIVVVESDKVSRLRFRTEGPPLRPLLASCLSLSSARAPI